MSNPLKGAPVTAEECSAEWIAIRREIILREGRAVRAGESAPTVEIKSLVTNEWAVLTLPNEATRFATVQDRDVVLAQLQH